MSDYFARNELWEGTFNFCYLKVSSKLDFVTSTQLLKLESFSIFILVLKSITFFLGDETGHHVGIIPRTIEKIFEETNGLVDKGWKYTMEASFLGKSWISL